MDYSNFEPGTDANRKQKRQSLPHDDYIIDGEDIEYKSKYLYGDIYIESTTNAFCCSAENVKNTPFLSHRRWVTTQLSRLQLSPKCGAYIGYNFHRRPHCMKPTADRRSVNLLASDKGIEVVNFPYNKTCVRPNDLVVIDQDSVEGHINRNEIDFTAVLKRVLKETDGTPCIDRGNIRVSLGFSTQNQRTELDGCNTIPQVIKATTKEDVELMCQMSSVLKQICESTDIDIPFTTDPLRNLKFAQYLCQMYGIDLTNLFEGGTSLLMKSMTF